MLRRAIVPFLRTMLMHATKEQIELWASFDLKRMEAMEAYIAIRPEIT